MQRSVVVTRTRWLPFESVHLIQTTSACVVYVLLLTLLTLPAATGKCVFKTHKNQTMVQNIYKRIAPLHNKRFTVKDSYGKFNYIVGICTPILETQSEDDTGVLQINLNKKNEKVKIGRISDVQIMAGSNWVLLEYHNGKNYTSHCGGSPRKASIMIICDESVTDDNPQLEVIEENRSKTTDCYYLFELSHPCVCKKKPFITIGLSVGSIIIIVFLSVTSAYLVIGFLYMRFILEAKGLEQIPNYGFWQDFGNLLADGCNLTCRSGSQTQQKTYKGIGDDQLQDDDEHDEHLLPM